jgi:hypothetical protein
MAIRIVGWGGLALGAGGMIFGLGPIGLALIFVGTAALLLDWEQGRSKR